MTKTADQILFPEKAFRVKTGWLRFDTIILKPYSIRELMAIRSGILDGATAALRRPPHWIARVKKKNPEAFLALLKVIDEINGWDPKEIAKQIEKKDKEYTPDDFYMLSVELIAAGHSPTGIWDYSPEQFAWHVGNVRRMKDGETALVSASAADAVRMAIISAFTKEGASLFDSFIDRMKQIYLDSQKAKT